VVGRGGTTFAEKARRVQAAGAVAVVVVNTEDAVLLGLGRKVAWYYCSST
jgi:hypothetical protein